MYISHEFFCRGFSFVDLIQDSRSRKLYALKRIICHSEEDKNDALKEVEYMNMFDQVNELHLFFYF